LLLPKRIILIAVIMPGQVNKETQTNPSAPLAKDKGPTKQESDGKDPAENKKQRRAGKRGRKERHLHYRQMKKNQVDPVPGKHIL
jgi:hypothetical protein